MAEEKSLSDYHSIQELAKNFSLEELLNLARKKNLHEWLNVNFYYEESKKIAAALDNNLGDAEIKLLICKIFNLSLENLSSDELDEISTLIQRKHRRELFFDDREGSDRKAAFVESQGELVKALQGGAEILYLYGGEFQIPHNLRDKTYIGRNNAIIDFTYDNDIDFDERNIIFEDLQIYLHNPVTLKIEKSKNVKILNGTRKSLGARPTLKEIFEILLGRGSFESENNFVRRAEDIRGAAVGSVLLTEENYFYDDAKFEIRPQWNFDYISVFKDYAADRKFFVNLAPEHAELIYTNERKQQIFADFTCIDGKLTILNLYLETVKLGRIAIESNFIVRKKENFTSSGNVALGYGLNLINDYDEDEDFS